MKYIIVTTSVALFALGVGSANAQGYADYTCRYKSDEFNLTGQAELTAINLLVLIPIMHCANVDDVEPFWVQMVNPKITERINGKNEVIINMNYFGSFTEA